MSAKLIINGRAIVEKKSLSLMPKCEYKYRFCGLPNGVSIPPRFAASVCIVKVKAIYFLFPVLSNVKKPRGRKVSRAISFAMIIEPMYVINTKAMTALRNV